MQWGSRQVGDRNARATGHVLADGHRQRPVAAVVRKHLHFPPVRTAAACLIHDALHKHVGGCCRHGGGRTLAYSSVGPRRSRAAVAEYPGKSHGGSKAERAKPIGRNVVSGSNRGAICRPRQRAASRTDGNNTKRRLLATTRASGPSDASGPSEVEGPCASPECRRQHKGRDWGLRDAGLMATKEGKRGGGRILLVVLVGGRR